MPAPNINTNTVIGVLEDGWWAGGSSLNLTYGTTGSAWTGYGGVGEPARAGYALFNTAQAAMFVQAMELWDGYVAAEFSETSGEGDIRVAFTTIAEADTWGYAYLPSTNASHAVPGKAGDIWVADDLSTSDFAVGSYDYSALLHEIGHALGLDHTFYESPGPASDALPTQYDNTRYSIMSYTDITDYWYSYFTPAGGGGISAEADGVNPITPMMFDILAVQDLYGKGNARAGATTYQFDPNLAALQTIFDASGVDTWNLAGHARRSVIDLRPASFSSIDLYTTAAQINHWINEFGEGYRTDITNWIDDPTTFTWQDNVAIAYGTIIENVICGNAADSVIGNAAANKLQGRRGADKLNGGAGNDTLIGGAGVDTLSGGGGADKFVLNAAGAANRDTIKDFAGADKIHLENSVFNKLGAAGNLAASKFWVGANAHDANDRIIYNATTGALYYDADGNRAGAKVQIATLTGHPALDAGDFLII